MNFNFLIFIFLTVACGVKGNPVSPNEASHPSVMDNYPDITVDQPAQDSKKK